MTLTERVTARLDEWEAVARAAHGPEWLVDGDDPSVILRPDKPGDCWDGFVIARLPEDDFGLVDHGNSAHIALHDPAAVLGLVAGLRTAVALHRPDARHEGDRNRVGCRACRLQLDVPVADEWPCPTLLAIAGALGLDAGGAE